MWPAYLIPDEKAQRFEQRMRRLWMAFFLIGIPATSIISNETFHDASRDNPFSYRLWIFSAALIVAYFIAIKVWVLHGIPRVRIQPGDLLPVDKRAREAAEVTAMGEGTIIAMVIAGILLVSLQMVVLIQDHYWWSFVGTLLFGACEIHFVRQLFLLRRIKAGSL